MSRAIVDVINMSWPTIVIVVAVLVIMRIAILLRGERKSFCLHKELFDLFFIIYLLMLFQVLTSQDVSSSGSNFIPFKEIFRYKYGTELFFRQIIGNILLFVPFGYFVSRHCKIKNLFSIAVMSCISSGVIECVQHFIGRCFDVDDIILNTFGAIIGFLIYVGLKAIKNHLPKFLRKDWVYNILSILLIIGIVMYLIKLF